MKIRNSWDGATSGSAIARGDRHVLNEFDRQTASGWLAELTVFTTFKMAVLFDGEGSRGERARESCWGLLSKRGQMQGLTDDKSQSFIMQRTLIVSRSGAMVDNGGWE
jgi:hypothetical protein